MLVNYADYKERMQQADSLQLAHQGRRNHPECEKGQARNRVTKTEVDASSAYH